MSDIKWVKVAAGHYVAEVPDVNRRYFAHLHNEAGRRTFWAIRSCDTASEWSTGTDVLTTTDTLKAGKAAVAADVAYLGDPQAILAAALAPFLGHWVRLAYAEQPVFVSAEATAPLWFVGYTRTDGTTGEAYVGDLSLITEGEELSAAIQLSLATGRLIDADEWAASLLTDDAEETDDTTTPAREVIEIQVCVDCTYYFAYGRLDDQTQQDNPNAGKQHTAKIVALWEGMDVTFDPGTGDDAGFSRSACDGCGSTLGGDRETAYATVYSS